MPNKVLIFAGTYEGRRLCGLISAAGGQACASVATPYGADMLDGLPGITVYCGRLDADGMCSLIADGGFNLVVDTTHPYASEVSVNIKVACERSGVRYLRLTRDEKEYKDAVYVSDTSEAVEYLSRVRGNILLTTGSKELQAYTRVPGFESRIYARVLPDPQVLEHCRKLGFSGKNIIAMQGPFSKELNKAMVSQYNCGYLVTKSTGLAGGVDNKVDTGAVTVMIGRPVKESGGSFDEVAAEVFGFLSLSRLNSFSEGTDENIHGEDESGEDDKRTYFPLFIDSKGLKAVVAGGGRVAARRIKTLTGFKFDITVVSESFNIEFKDMADSGINYISDTLTADNIEKYFSGADIIVAATNDRYINAAVGKFAAERGIYASIADDPAGCSFFFPAVVVKDGVVMGMTSEARDHRLVKAMAERVRNMRFWNNE